MSSIQTLTQPENGANSLIDINANFAALNATKVENTTTINSKALTGNINLVAADIPGVGTGTVSSVSSADANATVATGTTTPVITIVSAPKLQTARTIAGKSFDGTANISITASDVGAPSGSGTSSGTNTGDQDLSTYPTLTSTSTLSNKRITKRVVATTQSATPTINTDNGDIFEIAGLAQAITSMTTNLSGTPVEGEMIEIIFKDDGTARAITWGASFVSSTVTLPSTTVISTPLAVLLQYRTNAVWTATSAWYCIGVA
jgi:hypothetical protein